MKNHELQILQDQGIRFVDIPPGVSSKTKKFGPLKGPRVKGWQDQPYTLDQIKDTHNVGILTGEHSGGIIAVDFDGPWSWKAWDEFVGVPIPTTVTWTSGKDGRAQMMFRVNADLWQLLPGKKEVTGPIGDDGKPQQLEFRWRGCQSVLPPSVHEELGTEYVWLLPPSTTPIAMAPAELIKLAYELANPPAPPVALPPVSPSPFNFDDLTAVMKMLKQAHPTLPYGDWIAVTWACCATVGPQEAYTVMQQYYPEQQRGEYANLIKQWNPAQTPRIGRIRSLIPGAVHQGVLSTDQFVKHLNRQKYQSLY